MEHARACAVIPAAASVCACALSGGAVFTVPNGRSPAVVGGPSFEAQLQLPRDYRTIAGFEWTRSDIQSDLWRLGVLGGYSSPPEGRGLWGWEATARAGVLRSFDGATTGGGAFAGARVAVLLRLGGAGEPWQGDALIDVASFLVLDAGVNGLMIPGHPLETEIAARLLLRLQVSTAVLP